MDQEQNTPSKLARACWTITTVTCLLGAVIIFFKGDHGYGTVCLAVAVCAGINLL